LSDAPVCLVCGKPIKKVMKSLHFVPAGANGRENGERGDGGRTIYLDTELRPTTKEEAQRYVNYPILKVGLSQGRVYDITWWEGDYDDRHFHSQTCAAIFGRRMARAGHR
jgi:hypothetical protein